MNKFAESQAGEINSASPFVRPLLKKINWSFRLGSFEANQPFVETNQIGSLARLRQSVGSLAREFAGAIATLARALSPAKG